VSTLWCPAAATLVVGVRTRATRLTGLVTAALLVIVGAAVPAGLMDLGGTRAEFVAGLAVLAVNIVVVTLLAAPAPRKVSAPPRTIELRV
jgi:hypothetical protein